MEKATLCYNSAVAKKALEPVMFDVRGLSDVTDVFIIVSGSSNRQVQVIIDAVESALRAAGIKKYHKEGYENASWVLLDIGDVVVHAFSEESRSYYDLERLWKDAPKIEQEVVTSSENSV